ncbi:putative aldouronate transport system permease protein [Paenibacillus cellulosilyticus]|uniref:Putative aldouronate transport system permease protein n=1 Tax=Paenibacillus cellulosilyticus TaxID=375489 RepID=A0A2V2YUL2_9BACL|nr:ABC transporter permease subunit [Paenibacillus cellulosilyticus]PWW03317.1 putative aldouronate transport system permease protein [Paenibacillus cellulosilyticus]QKS43791.1 sugar ABC transporter permease [Paenibacillus cellulosilyticus]
MIPKSFSKHFYIMLIPGLVWLALFNLYPMYGVLTAFKEFNPGLGIWKSPWVGMENFQYMFELDDSKLVFRNTVVIAFAKMVGNLLVPFVFALMLNEVKNRLLTRTVQTVVYLPHFLSWVIVAGMMLDIFSYSGPVNQVLSGLGLDPIMFFGNAHIFPALVVGSDVWKEFGFNAIIFFSALTSINPEMYEAAAVDGASQWQRLIKITIPSIIPVAALLATLSLGNILNAGFDQIFNMYNPSVYSTGDIVDTWVYRAGLIDFQYGLATAVGLLKSVVGLVLITISYTLAYRFANYRIF